MKITQNDVDATTDAEMAYGTTRCLPKWEDIPEQFKQDIYYGTIYNRMIDAWFTGSALPQGEVSFNPGFCHDGKDLYRFITAHLRSFAPKHEHKIAGLAYLLSQVVTIKE